jgi:chaperonin GroEL (HSP60 family)
MTPSDKTLKLSTLLLKQKAAQIEGRRALHNNIQAGKLIADSLSSSFGPRGMEKMFIEQFEVIVTSDGREILRRMESAHPVGKMMYETSKWVDVSVGDGTISTALLIGALLHKAILLIDLDVHPKIIVDGYLEAERRAEAILNAISRPINPRSRYDLLHVAETSISTKVSHPTSSTLAALAVDAALQVTAIADGRPIFDPENIKVRRRAGGEVEDSRIISGIAIAEYPTSHTMPRRVSKARIVLINQHLERWKDKNKFRGQININLPEQMQQFVNEEKRIYDQMIANIERVGANVVISQQGYEDYVQIKLGRKDILAIRRADPEEMKHLSLALGVRIVADVNDLAPEDLGHAELVEERKLEDERWLFIEGCRNPKALTILLRGGSQTTVQEAERAVHNGLMAVRSAIDTPTVLAGGGASEAEVASQIRDWARALPGKEQLVAPMFAEALETIPIVLARNSGMNELDTILELRARHKNGERSAGIDSANRKVVDTFDRSILDPMAVKVKVVKLAAETASAILRADGIINQPEFKFRSPHPDMAPKPSPPLPKPKVERR